MKQVAEENSIPFRLTTHEGRNVSNWRWNKEIFFFHKKKKKLESTSSTERGGTDMLNCNYTLNRPPEAILLSKRSLG